MNRRPGRPLVSVVLSFRNEAENIPTLVARLEKMFAPQDVEYEVLFVNDASTDSSLSLLLHERQRNTRIRIVNMSRRFGVAEGVHGRYGVVPRRRDRVHGRRPAGSAGDHPGVDRSLAPGRRCRAHRTHASPWRESDEDGRHATGLPADSLGFVDSICRSMPATSSCFHVPRSITCCVCANRIRTCAASWSGSASTRSPSRTSASRGMRGARISRSSAETRGRRSRWA